MELIKNIIHNNKHKYEHISYYDLLIDKVEKNIESNPDIAIESCKSLIEGVSKFILKLLDNSYRDEEINELDFSQLFKKSLKTLSDYSEEIEFDFINRSGSLIHILGSIRNERGDISHGRLSPKEKNSTVQLAKLVKSMTDGIVFYMLDCLLSIDLSYKEEVKYEDNIEFNKMLDEDNQMPLISLSYSKALFDQEKETYLILLDDYNVENDIENELKPIKVV